MNLSSLKIINPKKENTQNAKIGSSYPATEIKPVEVDLAKKMDQLDKLRFQKKNQEGIWSNELIKLTQQQYADIFKAEEDGTPKAEIKDIIKKYDQLRADIQDKIWLSKKDRAILFKEFKFIQENGRLPDQKEVTSMKSRYNERVLKTDPLDMYKDRSNIQKEISRIKRILTNGSMKLKNQKNTTYLSDQDREDYEQKLQRELGYIKHYNEALKKYEESRKENH